MLLWHVFYNTNSTNLFMSNAQNLAAEILAAWQKQMQECLSNPKNAQIMVENYAKFQETINKFFNQPGSSSASSDGVDANVQLVDLTKRIEELELRVRILEKALAASS